MDSQNDHTAESLPNENSLVDELITRMNDLEERYKAQFKENPMPQTLYEIINSMSSEDSAIDPLRLCAIFSDIAESFLDRAVDSDKLLKQNSKLNNELHKANDLIRRLTEENEYHLNKLKFLAKQLEIYKDSWKGKLTEKSVERQISELLSEKDREVEEVRNKLETTEKEFMRYKFENRNSLNQSKLNADDEFRNFSDLKSESLRKSMVPRSFNIDKLYDELATMEHTQLIEYCIQLKQNETKERSKSIERQRPSSEMRSSAS